MFGHERSGKYVRGKGVSYTEFSMEHRDGAVQISQAAVKVPALFVVHLFEVA